MTVSEVIIEPMSGDFVVWRCLHGGPLSADNIEAPEPHPAMNWPATRSRNAPLLRKIIDTYGSCAMLARDDQWIVGTLRFYPKALMAMTPDGLGFCLQQEFPSGPAADLVGRPFPVLDEIADKTLVVHCMMTGSPSRPANPYQRQGIATRLVRALADWAGDRGWQAIEATAYEDLPFIYAITGQAGRRFWEKEGFRVVGADTEPAFLGESDFAAILRSQARTAGLDPGRVQNRFTMRLELA